MDNLMKLIREALSAGTLTIEGANTIIQKAKQLLDMFINLQIDINNPVIAQIIRTQVESTHTLSDLQDFNPEGPWVDWTEIKERSEALSKAVKLEDTVEALALALKVISMFGGLA
jgi:hypothetical protein